MQLPLAPVECLSPGVQFLDELIDQFRQAIWIIFIGDRTA